MNEKSLIKVVNLKAWDVRGFDNINLFTELGRIYRNKLPKN
jgi:hypothetical protein